MKKQTSLDGECPTNRHDHDKPYRQALCSQYLQMSSVLQTNPKISLKKSSSFITSTFQIIKTCLKKNIINQKVFFINQKSLSNKIKH